METGKSATEIGFRSPTGAHRPALRFSGRLGASSWNRDGFVAAADDTLIALPAGSRTLVKLDVDTGYRSARDVCLTGPRSAVVALDRFVALVTDRSRTVIAGFAARCRWEAGVLYLLDAKNGFIWSIKGLETMAGAAADSEHATRLVRELSKDTPETHPAFLEAARLVGCRTARDLRNGVVKTVSDRKPPARR